MSIQKIFEIQSEYIYIYAHIQNASDRQGALQQRTLCLFTKVYHAFVSGGFIKLTMPVILHVLCALVAECLFSF
jgi:hypothetical protein